MGKTNIGWADQSINFYDWHCNKVSQGCKFCYAESLAKRYGKTFNGTPNWRENAVAEFKRLKAGEAVFINDMSDTFHEGVSSEMIKHVFYYARQRPDVTFLILTKRIRRAYEMQDELIWADNIYLGTSVESAEVAERIKYLRQTRAMHRFISFEPLLGDVGQVDLTGIDGVITGGESGPNRRPFKPQWALNILALCQQYNVRMFHKQGGAFKPGEDRLLNGRTYDELPWSTVKQVTPAEQPADVPLF
jgi:protein gp37